MYMVASSETGVSRGLAASALLQHAKLQRHFLGAAVNRGNRSGEVELCYLETARSFVVFSSAARTHSTASRFPPFPPCRYYPLNIKFACPPPHVYVCIWEAWQHAAGSQAGRLSSWCPDRVSEISPNCHLSRECPLFAAFCRLPSRKASVFTNAWAEAIAA